METFIDRDEGLYKKVEDILSQLTPHNFQMLGERITNLNINTKESLEGVVDLIFEKAVDEPSSPIVYANLCKCLALMKVPVGNTENNYVPFRKVLLNKCQKEFESSIVDEVGKTQRSKDVESAETEEKKTDLDHDYLDVESKAKRRYLGNVRFIGELFKLNMLTVNIIHDCLKELLIQEAEHPLECLCCLLSIVGRDLDAGRNHYCDELVDDTIDGHFKQMREIANKAETTSRVRFMLQNVMELRLNNWVPLRDESAPTTGDKFYQRLERETIRKEHHLQRPAAFRRDIVYEGSLGEDWWNAMGSTTALRRSDPILRLKKVTVEDIRFGPGGQNFKGWSMGSSGDQRTTIQEPENWE